MSASKVICIVGPTASGKTAAALNTVRMLQEQGLQSIVINADSRQVYRDFPIITAQPSTEEKRVCPHHLYGWLETNKRICAGEWADLARKEIEYSITSNKIPILVGGTGFYIRALVDGIADIPAPSDDLRQKILSDLARYGAPELHVRLSKIDPEYASKIHPNDSQRCCRALEVWESTGKTFSWWHSQTPPPSNYSILHLGVGLPLSELEPLLLRRINFMIEAGAMEEARKALTTYPDITSPGWSGIGCTELALHLTGKISLEECIERWQHNTRAYAKRQWTWFKSDKRISWYRPENMGSLMRTISNFIIS